MSLFNSIKYIYQKQFKRIVVLLTILFLTVGAWNIYYQTELNQRSNDECIWQVPSGTKKIVFNLVKYEGVSWNAGIRDGDILIAVNDIKVKSKTDLAQFLINQVEVGDSALYTVSRDGKEFDTLVEIKRVYNISGIAYTILGIFWLLVSHIVIMAKPYGKVQRKFYWIGIVLSLSAFLGFHNLYPPYDTIKEPTPIYAIVDISYMFGLCFLPFAFINFFWHFPTKRKFVEIKFVKASLFLVPLFYFTFIIWQRFKHIGEMQFYTGSISLMAIVAMFGIFIGLISLFRSYLNIKSKKERTPIFVILVTYFLGFASIVYYWLANLYTKGVATFNSPEILFPIVIVVLLPLAFAYSIFRYSLMDVSEVLKSTVTYTAATITLGLTYFILIYLLGQVIGAAIGTEYQAIIAGVVFIGFAFIFQSTKDKFQNLLTEKFYPEQFAFQKLVVKFGNEISTIVGLDKILDAVQDTFTESLKIDRLGILIRSENKQFCELRRSVGLVADEFHLENVEEKILQRIEAKSKSGHSPVIEHLDFTEVFGEKESELTEMGIYTIIPLIIKFRIIGIVMFGLKYSGAQFAGKDLDLLVATCNQLAVAIENARLYASEADKLKYERDLENAKKIQTGLLPGCIPNFNGLDICGTMLPAMIVGGDYYDLIKVSESKIFVVVGDVSGKGLAASFYMSKLQTMIQLFCNEDATPKDVLIEINKQIYNQIEKNWFITVAVGLFDMDKKTLHFCRAGHTPLLKANSSKVEEYIPKGIGLGLESGKVFEQTIEQLDITINTNDIFAFYSDGLTEAMNPEMEIFGQENLEKILKLASAETVNYIESEIMNTLSRFKENAIQNDDITLVLIKVK